MGVNCLCFDTLRTEEGHLLKDHFPPFPVLKDGTDKEDKVFGCEECICLEE